MKVRVLHYLVPWTCLRFAPYKQYAPSSPLAGLFWKMPLAQLELEFELDGDLQVSLLDIR